MRACPSIFATDGGRNSVHSSLIPLHARQQFMAITPPHTLSQWRVVVPDVLTPLEIVSIAQV